MSSETKLKKLSLLFSNLTEVNLRNANLSYVTLIKVNRFNKS
ncbi:pentapeptide repeat-containing protein [cyanobacterium endosymbiont of Rhopalodia gibberula]